MLRTIIVVTRKMERHCNCALLAAAHDDVATQGLTVGEDFHFICNQTSDVPSTLNPSIDTIEEDIFAAGAELGACCCVSSKAIGASPADAEPRSLAD